MYSLRRDRQFRPFHSSDYGRISVRKTESGDKKSPLPNQQCEDFKLIVYTFARDDKSATRMLFESCCVSDTASEPQLQVGRMITVSTNSFHLKFLFTS